MPFDLSDGIDIDEAAVVAVVNNPGLRALRAGMGVAQAQVFAAGLFPDPQVSLGSDNPTNQTDTQVHAYTLGIGYDLGALITRNPTQAAADAAAEQVRLDVVWQEWQVAQQARIAATRYRTQARKLDVLRAARDRFAARAEASMKALEQGRSHGGRGGNRFECVARQRQPAVSAGVAAQRYRSRTRWSARAAAGGYAAVDRCGRGAARCRRDVDVAAIEQRRPDLLALRAGYESQEARVRLAVWHQFPALTVTWNRARDTSSVWTTGFSAALNLPLFTGARGEIAVEKATREKLHAEYLDRLAQTRSDVVAPAGGRADRESRVWSTCGRASRNSSDGGSGAPRLHRWGARRARVDQSRLGAGHQQNRTDRSGADAMGNPHRARHAARAGVAVTRVDSSDLRIAADDADRGAGGRGGGADAESEALVAVTTAPAVAEQVEREITSYGIVEPDPDAADVVALPRAGVIRRVLVRQGERVRMGQILVELDTAPGPKLQWEQAVAAVRYAEEQLARLQRMAANRLATDEQVAQARRDLSDAQATEQSLRSVGADTKQQELRATRDAVVTAGVRQCRRPHRRRRTGAESRAASRA